MNQPVALPPPVVCLRLLGTWGGEVIGAYLWQRAPGPASEAARFVPVGHAPESAATSSDDCVHLSLLRLIAHGTPAHHEVPIGPFEIEHSLSTRVFAINGHVIPPDTRVPVLAGDEIQLGLMRLVFVSPSPDPGEELDPLMDSRLASSPLHIHDAFSVASPDIDEAEAPGAKVMRELHRRYHASLIDAAALGEEGRCMADHIGLARQASRPDPMDALTSRTVGQGGIFDLLSPQATMDELIAQADANGEGALLADDAVESVLHLFAPTRPQPSTPGIDEIWLGKVKATHGNG